MIKGMSGAVPRGDRIKIQCVCWKGEAEKEELFRHDCEREKNNEEVERKGNKK